MASLANFRMCSGVGGRTCGRRMSSLDRDPHPTCPTCRGKQCFREDPCSVCFNWPEDQWARYSSRKKYQRKAKPGGSIPSFGGGSFVMFPPAGSGAVASAAIPQDQQGALVPVCLALRVAPAAGAAVATTRPIPYPLVSIPYFPLFLLLPLPYLLLLGLRPPIFIMGDR